MFGGMNANAGGWLGEFYVRRVFDLGVRAYLLCWPSLPWGLPRIPLAWRILAWRTLGNTMPTAPCAIPSVLTADR